MLAIPARRPLMLGGGLYMPPANNVISNWRGQGQGGTGGLPDGWNASWPAGVNFSVVGRTTHRGSTAIELMFTGTATASGPCTLICGLYAKLAPAGPGQVWNAQVFAQAIGIQAPSAARLYFDWQSASGGWLASNAATELTATILSPYISQGAGPPNTAFVSPVVVSRGVAAGQTVNLRYRIFAPTLWRVS